MRPLDEQTILITVATDGLGRAVAAELAAAGATLLIHGRNDARGQQTIDDIAARTGNRRLHWLRADLASLGEVRDLAGRVAAEHPRVGILVNNAGIGYTSHGDNRRMESRDRYELRFAVNYLAGIPGDQAAADAPARQRAGPGRQRRIRELSDRLCGLAPAAQDAPVTHHAGGAAS